MSLIDWVTLAIAIIGAVLGVINSYYSWLDRSVRLKVTPAWSVAPEFTGMSITVTNSSKFPITVIEIGFTLDRSRASLPKRMMIPEERLYSGSQEPTRLEPHSAKTISFAIDGLESYEIAQAYALTDTGLIARGSSGALKQFIARGNKPI